jgi:hypothetical protein
MDEEENREVSDQEPGLEEDQAPVSTTGETQAESLEDDGMPLPNYGDGKIPDMLLLGGDPVTVEATIYAYKDSQSGRLKSITLDPSPCVKRGGVY